MKKIGNILGIAIVTLIGLSLTLSGVLSVIQRDNFNHPSGIIFVVIGVIVLVIANRELRSLRG
jgi:cadmium resistance protein CadD (predicted permease)